MVDILYSVVFFLLGDSPVSEFYTPTFRNALLHLHRQVGMTYDWNPVILCTYLLMKMEQIQYSEMSAYKIQMPGNYPEERTQHSEHGESLKSRILYSP